MCLTNSRDDWKFPSPLVDIAELIDGVPVKVALGCMLPLYEAQMVLDLFAGGEHAGQNELICG